MDSLIVESHSLEETREFGQHLARLLQPGDVVSLVGNLGAGKTHLVQAIAAGLGVDPESVQSPTFVLIQEYAGRIPICHLDTYRLRDIDEFLELGADELLGGDNVCLVEWGDKVDEVLPRDRLTVQIEAIGLTARRLTLICSGPRSELLLKGLIASDSSPDERSGV